MFSVISIERLDLNCVKVKEKNFLQHPEQSRHCHSGGDGLLFWLSERVLFMPSATFPLNDLYCL